MEPVGAKRGRAVAAYLVAGVRTPFGRYGGALAAVRPDDLAAHVRRRAHRSAAVGRLGRRGRRRARLREPGRRGQPQRRPDGGAARRPAGRGARRHREPAVRVRPGRRRHRGPGRPRRRGRPGARRRRGEHDPRAVRHAEGRRGVVADGRDATTPPSVGGSSTRRCASGTAPTSMPETAENVAERVRHLPGRPGRVRAALPGARGQGDRRRPAGQGDRAGVRCRSGGANPWSSTVDEHPRATSIEALAKLRPIFPGGTVTAGNSSGINDGAAAVLVASEDGRAPLRPEPLARVDVGAVAGVPPRR